MSNALNKYHGVHRDRLRIATDTDGILSIEDGKPMFKDNFMAMVRVIESYGGLKKSPEWLQTLFNDKYAHDSNRPFISWQFKGDIYSDSPEIIPFVDKMFRAGWTIKQTCRHFGKTKYWFLKNEDTWKEVTYKTVSGSVTSDTCQNVYDMAKKRGLPVPTSAKRLLWASAENGGTVMKGPDDIGKVIVKHFIKNPHFIVR